MKVLHIGKYYAPIEGGIEAINHTIVEALKDNETQQRVISFNSKNMSVEEDIDDTCIVRTASLGVVASQPLSLKYLTEMRRAINMFQPDIIHFHYPNPLGAIFLRLSIEKHNKLIVHWHSDIVAQKKILPLLRPIENWLLKRADVIIATSPLYAKTSEPLLHWSSKIKVIPCSINENNFILNNEDKKAIKEIKIQYGNKPIIFFIGRHVEYKGIEFLLKAEKEVQSDCVFIIAGKGPLTETLKSKYNSERIKWIGRISNEQIRRMMHAATLFAFPSITKNEAFGIALAEAMYCDLPAITFTIQDSGVNWVCPNNECGIEIENGNYLKYAKAIDALIENDDKRLLLAQNAHNRVVEKFTTESVTPRYVDLYRELYLKKQ